MCGLLGFAGVVSQRTVSLDEARFSEAFRAVRYRGTSECFITQTEPGAVFGYAILPTDGLAKRRSYSHAFRKNGEAFLFNGWVPLPQHSSGVSTPSLDTPDFDVEFVYRGLRKHGGSFLKGCDGMYAGAWVTPEQIMLFRDSSGIKPLFWSSLNDLTWGFSSLASSLAHFSPIIEEVAPGEIIRIDRRTGNIRRESVSYEGNTLHPAVYLKHTTALSSQRYLEGFPTKSIGVLLSGGVDSSLIFKTVVDAVGSCNRHRVVAFVAGTKESSDAKAAKEVVSWLADHIDGEVQLVRVEPPTDRDVLSSIDNVITTLETDNARDVAVGLINERLAHAVRRRGINVLYTGQGMDEIAGGYLETFTKLCPSLPTRDCLRLHSLYRRHVFPGSLLARDDRIFGHHQIETRPIPALPGFIASMGGDIPVAAVRCPKGSIVPKYRIRAMARNHFGLKETFAFRQKVRMEEGARLPKPVDNLFSFGASKKVEEETAVSFPLYCSQIHRRNFSNTKVYRSGQSESEFFHRICGRTSPT